MTSWVAKCGLGIRVAGGWAGVVVVPLGSVVVGGGGGRWGGGVIGWLSSHSDWEFGGLSGFEDNPSPQSSSSNGYLNFVLLFFPEVGVLILSSITSNLLLAGDLTSPPSMLMTCPTSSALITTILVDSHLLILSSPFYKDS